MNIMPSLQKACEALNKEIDLINENQVPAIPNPLDNLQLLCASEQHDEEDQLPAPVKHEEPEIPAQTVVQDVDMEEAVALEARQAVG